MRWRPCRRQLAAVAVWLATQAPCAAAGPTETFQFGTAGLGAPLTNRFALRNAGPGPMNVVTALPSCECIRILSHPAVVADGETGAVEVLFVPDKAGKVDYRIYVETSSWTNSRVEYAIQGVVTAAPLARADRDWPLYLWTEEAGKIVEEPQSAVLVDVRGAEAYGRVRIPGSLQIPSYAVKTKDFLKGRRVVLVDDGHGSRALEEECRRLRERGFPQASIWYGGLNAWRRRGGELEGDGSAVDRLPPDALHDIALSTDWLVVAAEGPPLGQLAESIAIPFDPSKKEEFVSALNAAIAARPQAGSVLLLTDAGGDYRAFGEIAGRIDAFVFFLEGGRAAWDAHAKMMGAVRRGPAVVVRKTAAAGGARVRPGGCGGCPK